MRISISWSGAAAVRSPGSHIDDPERVLFGKGWQLGSMRKGPAGHRYGNTVTHRQASLLANSELPIVATTSPPDSAVGSVADGSPSVIGPSKATVASVDIWWTERTVDSPIRMSFGTLARRVMAVVEVTDTDGFRGRGESWTNYPSWALNERVATVREGLAPVLRGAVVDLVAPGPSIAEAHSALLDALWPFGRQWGAPGPIMQAISGADQALWDLVGVRRGMAVAELVAGGAGKTTLRRTVPVYASGLGPEHVASQVKRCRKAGFLAVKLRVGFGIDVDKVNLREARRELGDDGELLVDANQAWSPAEAREMAGALQSCSVSWVEEPIADATSDELADFSVQTGLVVAAGENVYGRRAWKKLIETPGIGVLQPDVSKQGGITELLWLCAEAEAAGRRVEPHLYGGAVAYAATLQVAACTPAIARVELDVRPGAMSDGKLMGPPEVSGGMVEVPLSSGLGLDFENAREGRMS